MIFLTTKDSEIILFAFDGNYDKCEKREYDSISDMEMAYITTDEENDVKESSTRASRFPS